MRNKILLFGGAAALLLLACIVAPNEPAATSQNGLTCSASQKLFNGSCRQICTKTADCPSGTACMLVGGDAALCLDFKHCAYLGDDTQCHRASGYGYSSYSSVGPKDPYDPYGFGGTGCAGNAAWQVIAPSGDPECGVAHAVKRCAPVAGGGCGLVSGSTVDVADP